MLSAERKVSWLELFFDLVVVAAIAQLAHRLHDAPTLNSIGVFTALYLAVWVAWASFTLYANVAGEATRRRIMLLAMLGIAVMAATIPQATGERVLAFTIAYIIVRTLALSTWFFARRSLFAWPALVGAIGVTPWVISLAVPSPAKYLLWGIGLAADMLLPLFFARRTTRPNEKSLIDLSHLAERLGLFMIIVLGEAVLQLVTEAGKAPWTMPLLSVIVAGFTILIGLWWPMFRYGFIASGGRSIEVRAVMPLHFVNTLSITAMAAGLGVLTAHPSGHVEPAARWLIYGGATAYYLAVAIGGMVTGAGHRRWRSSWGLAPCIILPAAVAVFGSAIPGALLAWPLVAVIGWQIWYADRQAAKFMRPKAKESSRLSPARRPRRR